MWAAYLLTVFLGGVFEDTQKRFHVDLPETWVYEPQPGNNEAVSFARRSGGVFAGAVVFVSSVPAETTLEGYAASVLGLYAQEPGFRVLEKKPCLLGMLPAQCHRYVVAVPGGKNLSKMVQEHVVLGPQSKAYLLHMECVSEAYPLVEQDFTHLGESFRFGAQAWGAAKTPANTSDMLAGTWVGDGHTLVLSPRGAVVFEGQTGTYQARGGVLTLRFLKNKKKVFNYSLEGDTLHLRGGAFAAGVALKRTLVEPALQ
jgi:hypothetical protein